MRISPVAVQATIRSDDRPELTGTEVETATVHVAGLGYGVSLHFTSLDDLEKWWHALGENIAGEFVRRRDARRALAEMDEALRKAGAR